MAANHDLNYASANGLLTKMSVLDILELTTESIDAIEGSEEQAQMALDYLDGVEDVESDDLEESGKHIAFVVLELLRWAESFVDSYGGRRYDVPMLASDGKKPREVVDVVLTVARYRLFNRRSILPDDVVADYEQAMSWLERLADGRVVLNLAKTGDSSPSVARAKTGFSDRSSAAFSTSVF